jgi:hypothetical protein
MIDMKCLKCDGLFTLPDHARVPAKYCPYCGAAYGYLIQVEGGADACPCGSESEYSADSKC